MTDPRRASAYAGIGSRQTPADVLELMELTAAKLARRGWLLRTGGSPGADQSFYRGALAAHGRVELYLPWPGFEAAARGEDDTEVRLFGTPSNDAYALAARFHPGWNDLAPAARHLLARDGHQVLGADLASPVQFVVCWTSDGGLDGSSPRSGGTGHALRIAHHYGLPVFNLARPDHARRAAGACAEGDLPLPVARQLGSDLLSRRRGVARGARRSRRPAVAAAGGGGTLMLVAGLLRRRRRRRR